MCRLSKLMVITVACGALAAITACVVGPRVQPRRSAQLAAMHAVHDEHVSSLMRSISRSHTRVQSYRQPLLRARARNYAAVKMHANEIAHFADELRGFANRKYLVSSERELFRTYLTGLREHATELANAAEVRDEIKAKRAFAKLTATCNSCHFAFREHIGN